MTHHDDLVTRTPEERLLARKRLGSFYLNDVRTLIARAEAAEAEVTRLREGLRRIVGESYNLITQGESPTQRRQPSAQRIYEVARSLLDDKDT